MNVADVAARFAAALDADDFAAAGQLLAPDGRYEVRGEVLVGPGAILKSYREASEAARREFDRVTYSSRVIEATLWTATIEFADHIERAGVTHTFRSRQHLEVKGGLITAIRHEDLPGEWEKLTEFRNARRG
jgi:hypothetical protein